MIYLYNSRSRLYYTINLNKFDPCVHYIVYDFLDDYGIKLADDNYLLVQSLLRELMYFLVDYFV